MVYVIRVELAEDKDYNDFVQELYNNDMIVDVDLLEVYDQ